MISKTFGRTSYKEANKNCWLSSLGMFVLIALLSLSTIGCKGQPRPSSTQTSNTRTVSSQPAKPITIDDLLMAYLEMESAVAEYRALEISVSGSGSFLANAGITAMKIKADTNRSYFNSMLKRAKKQDIPEIEQIRRDYQKVATSLSLYNTRALANSVRTGLANSSNTGMSYQIFLTNSARFKQHLMTLQMRAAMSTAAAEAAAAAAPTPSGGTFDGDAALKAAYENYYSLVNSGADGAKIREAAAEIERAKATVQRLVNR
jgi:hypothetical protein